MWKPMVRCSIVGGIIVFLWLAIAWMLLPMHQATIHQFANESEVVSSIIPFTPEDGIYVAPSWDENASGKPSDSPFIFLNIQRGINSANMTRNIVIGLITQIVGAALVTYLLLHAKVMKYWGRVWFVTLIGVTVALLGSIPAWNWWHFPAGWVMLEMFDLIVGWFLGGLVISKLVKN